MKNMNKVIKIVYMLVIAVMLISTVTPVFGSMIQPGSITPSYDNTATNDLQSIAGKVMGLIRNIAVIAGVILLMVIGVKFMMGSAEEKAEYKKSLVPLVVGIVVVMAATQIVTMIFGIVG